MKTVQPSSSANTLQLIHIAYSYPASTLPVFEDLDLGFHPGWTGIAGANGCGKTTLLNLAAGVLKPDSGVITAPDTIRFCVQKTDKPPKDMAGFFEALYDGDSSAGRLSGILAIGHDWPYRWETLSQGERKRMQIAAALYVEPELLLLDEPTNHLDSNARALVTNALAEFTGTGLLVSHDRALMDLLCRRCVFLRSTGATVRPGGYTRGRETEDLERVTREREHEKARSDFARLKKEAENRRELARNQQNRRSKKGLALKDYDARFKRNLARITGKDGTGGRLLRQLDGRIEQARNRVVETEGVGRRKEGLTFHAAASRCDFLLRLEGGRLQLSEDKTLEYPELILRPGDRIALTGMNGCGKSTLIRHIGRELENTPVSCCYFPQELENTLLERLITQFQALDNDEKGRVISTMYRLGCEPESILVTPAPSPGEIRKLQYALAVEQTPQLFILDEPTNHIDLPAMESLEEALTSIDCAILLVSHDAVFRSRLTGREWCIAPAADGIFRLSVEPE